MQLLQGFLKFELYNEKGMKMRKVYLPVLTALILTSCGGNRYDFVDVASSERTVKALSEGFREVPDSLPGGRSAWLLSQGIQVADVLLYAGDVPEEDVVVPEIPYGYDASFISSDELLNSLCARGTRLYTDNGRNARVLMLLDETLSLEVLNKIASLADSGAIIGGVKPTACVNREDSLVFRRTVERVWTGGNVMSGKTILSLLKAANVLKDEKTRTDGLVFSHRHLPDAEIYSISNPTDRSGRIRVKFRVRGRRPMLWNPDTGDITPVSYNIKKKGTRVKFQIVPQDEVFIVFGSYADHKKMKIKK